MSMYAVLIDETHVDPQLRLFDTEAEAADYLDEQIEEQDLGEGDHGYIYEVDGDGLGRIIAWIDEPDVIRKAIKWQRSSR